MNPDILEKAVNLAKTARHVLIATADDNGLPHVTAAGKLDAAGDSAVAVTEWFCPGTVANLQKNRNMSIVVWTGKLETGYQLLGQLDGVRDIGILDGYSAKVEEQHPMPQIEKRLLVKVDKILEFRLGPHTDVED